MRRAVRSLHFETVFQAIRFLSNWITQLTRGNRDTLRISESIQAIVAAMEAFPLDGEIQRVGCDAFYCFAELESNETPLLVKAQAIRIVVRAMKDHTDDVVLQRYACLVLDKACLHPSNRGKLLDAGALGAVSNAYEKHARTCKTIRGARTTKVLVDSIKAKKRGLID
jgi:hypothetical protein